MKFNEGLISQKLHFVPLRGVRYLYTDTNQQNAPPASFRPLSGSKVSELAALEELKASGGVSVPSRGLRYLNGSNYSGFRNAITSFPSPLGEYGI